MEVQNGGALIATAIAHALILRLDVAAEFVRSHSESKDVPEDVKFKAKMVSGCNNLVESEALTKVVVWPVRLRVHIHYTMFSLGKAKQLIVGTALALGGFGSLVSGRS